MVEGYYQGAECIQILAGDIIPTFIDSDNSQAKLFIPLHYTAGAAAIELLVLGARTAIPIIFLFYLSAHCVIFHYTVYHHIHTQKTLV